MNATRKNTDSILKTKKHGTQLLIVTVVSSMLLLACFACTLHAESPRDKFREELFRKFDALVAALKEMRPGNVTRKEKVFFQTSKRATGPIDSDMPLAFTITKTATEIREHFGTVPLGMLSDMQGFDAWSDKLKADYSKRMAEVSKEVKRIKEQYQKDAKAFATQGVDLVETPTVGLTEEGELYFDVAGRGYVLERALNIIDLTAWTAEIKKMKLKLPEQVK